MYPNLVSFYLLKNLKTCLIRKKILGILDQSSDNEDLKQGSKVDVPFWMIPTLHAKKVITFEVPRYYKVNYRLVNLNNRFYSLQF